ncbi:DNA/RNA nuclease SfsA [Geotoga petraea]|uniref:Sugar fermentation stimulation protein homolog n=1 Tax=Geotoga petraea TaxID=28234 RepID=A0A4Z0VX28_9BACT|nr:DNA/RNA nuclease SfsA [Geotoga petraea]TGG88648.1 DNA/RNA nuclease SfsA [Geotoga petraea]
MKLMEIKTDYTAIFKSRPNRYIAEVDIPELNLENEEIHVHDPGRLKELLYPGNKIKIKKANNTKRKTKWDLIAAEKGSEEIMINSAYHRNISYFILNNENINPFGKLRNIKAEVKYNKSRLDYLVEDAKNNKIWIEIKGCTLTEDGVAKFPDSPTLRGTRHLEELIEIKENGEEAAIILLVFGKSECFRPNKETDTKFAETFHKAMKVGVKIYPIQLSYENGIISYEGILPICE